MKNSKEKIINILKKNVDELEHIDITDNLPLISSGFISSFDLIKIISDLKTAFNLSITLENLNIEDFNSVSSIAKLISKLESYDKNN